MKTTKIKEDDIIDLDNYKCKILKICNAPLMAIPLERIKNIKSSKGKELKIEMPIDNSLRITPIPTGPARSEEDECASPNLKLRGDSIELYNY